MKTIYFTLIKCLRSIHLVDCYLNRNGNYCWIFSTRGLCTVAQDELVFILDENINNANNIISDLLIHIHQIYIDAIQGIKAIVIFSDESKNLMKMGNWGVIRCLLKFIVVVVSTHFKTVSKRKKSFK